MGEQASIIEKGRRMAVTQLDLQTSASAAANASGVAVATIGPQSPYESWHITNLAVTSTATTVNVYRGPIGDIRLSDSTPVGVASSDTVYDLGPGEFLTVQWTGCAPGSVSTVTVMGDRTVRGRVAY